MKLPVPRISFACFPQTLQHINQGSGIRAVAETGLDGLIICMQKKSSHYTQWEIFLWGRGGGCFACNSTSGDFLGFSVMVLDARWTSMQMLEG